MYRRVMISRENDNLRTCINRKFKRMELLLLSQGKHFDGDC